MQQESNPPGIFNHTNVKLCELVATNLSTPVDLTKYSHLAVKTYLYIDGKWTYDQTSSYRQRRIYADIYTSSLIDGPCYMPYGTTELTNGVMMTVAWPTLTNNRTQTFYVFVGVNTNALNPTKAKYCLYGILK